MNAVTNVTVNNVAVKSVSKRFGATVALDGVDAQFGPGVNGRASVLCW